MRFAYIAPFAAAAVACSSGIRETNDATSDGGSRAVTEPDGAVVVVSPDGATVPYDGSLADDGPDGGIAMAGDAGFVTGAHAGNGPANGPCPGVTSAPGTVLDFPWAPGIS